MPGMSAIGLRRGAAVVAWPLLSFSLRAAQGEEEGGHVRSVR
jgi:hypothetical protein